MSLTGYVDGACRVSNPGQTSCAYVIYDGDQEIDKRGVYLGPELHTNNYAEYQGLLMLLFILDYNGHRRVTIYSDSMLVVGQVNLELSIKKHELEYLAMQAYGLLVRGGHKLEHIKGHEGSVGNERADQLCNEALDRAGF